LERGRAVDLFVGSADRGDGAEWSVVLAGNRLSDVDEKTRPEVSGTLRVIHHPAVVVGDVLIDPWVEVRVEGK
jgi:hypothetical protein